MLLPERIKITNYCQIKSLELDFSNSSTFAITGPNGCGKSNALYALRFALSGQASPQADKLIDDIRDNEQSCTVVLDFKLDNGTGTITRTITRKGTECDLQLEIDGKKEVYKKSTSAEKRFTELLGVSPKHIGEVIIADQHNIDALLFWPGSERAPKFQRFLHGQVFQELEKIIAGEKKRTVIDPRVIDRLKTLQQTINAHKAQEHDSSSLVKRLRDALDSNGTKNLKKKAEQVKKFAELKTKRDELDSELQTKSSEANNLRKELNCLRLPDEKTFKSKLEASSKAEAEWEAFRPYQQAQAKIKELELRKSEIEAQIKTLEQELNLEPKLKDEKAELESALEYKKLTRELSAQEKILSENKDSLALANVRMTEWENEKTKLKEQSSSCPVRTLHFLGEVLKYVDATKDKECPVCGGEVAPARLKSIKSEYKQLESQHTSIEEQIQTTELKIRKAATEVSRIETVIGQASTEITRIANAIKSIGEIKQFTNPEELYAKCTEKLSSFPHLRAELTKLTKDLTLTNTHIGALEKTPRAEEPSTTNQARSELLAEVQTMQKVLEAHRTTAQQLSSLTGEIKQLEQAIGKIDREIKEEGLPEHNVHYVLTEQETEQLETIAQLESDAKDEELKVLGAKSAISALEEQMRHTKLEVAAFEESKQYLSDLGQLDEWFRPDGIPSKILQKQLNNLCGKMEEVVSQFSLTRNFKLTVDSALDVYMLYPDGTIRAIQKASGGERIILGIAFRLATHRYLAPELPFLALDEPTNHLVQSNQVALQEIIRELKNNLGKYGIKKLLFCTHSLPLAGEAEEIIDLTYAT